MDKEIEIFMKHAEQYRSGAAMSEDSGQ